MATTSDELRKRASFDRWHMENFGVLAEWSIDPAHHAYPTDNVIRARWYGYSAGLDQAAAELDALRADVRYAVDNLDLPDREYSQLEREAIRRLRTHMERVQ